MEVDAVAQPEAAVVAMEELGHEKENISAAANSIDTELTDSSQDTIAQKHSSLTSASGTGVEEGVRVTRLRHVLNKALKKTLSTCTYVFRIS